MRQLSPSCLARRVKATKALISFSQAGKRGNFAAAARPSSRSAPAQAQAASKRPAQRARRTDRTLIDLGHPPVVAVNTMPQCNKIFDRDFLGQQLFEFRRRRIPAKAALALERRRVLAQPKRIVTQQPDRGIGELRLVAGDGAGDAVEDTLAQAADVLDDTR